MNSKSFFSISKKIDIVTSVKKGVVDDDLESINNKIIHTMSNHPVHISDEDGAMSASSFIPFCAFNGNMSSMGVRIEKFDVAVCNSFKPKILKDQLCYQVDVNDQKFTAESLNFGLTFLVDTNDDRQFRWDPEEEEVELTDTVFKNDKNKGLFMIYIDTLGRNIEFDNIFNIQCILVSSSETVW